MKLLKLLRSTYKSLDTEENIDLYFTRPIGLLFALFFKKIGWTPNAVTILSYFLGMGPLAQHLRRTATDDGKLL